MAVLTLLEAINQALDQKMAEDSRVVVFGEDAGFEGGVFRVTAGLQKKYGEDRVFDTPIAEAAITGSAIGMAINGLIPVAEIQFDGFVFPGYTEIVTHMARYRNRSRGRHGLPIVVRFPVGGGIRALEHHSESIETLLGHIPGLKVVIPSTPYDAKGLLVSAIEDPDPVIFMEPKRIYRSGKQEVPNELYRIPIGKAKVVKEGTDVTVVAWGAIVREVEKAMKLLENDNINVELIDLRSISPIDEETIINSVKKTGRFVVVQEAVKTYGPGAELISLVNEKAFLHLEAAPARVTGFDITVPLAKGENYHFVQPERIAAEIKKVAKF
ncbi:MAG: 2-oxoisovalerate dehydrogenase [Tenericutes bacterium GWC2_34_14]|nr:MAG: 2-oxoisovalerate dehydrogenase [Tenericutes bacterium GWA2_35_7]OHE30008.1 MAG: 2-oxoisovalerate dehydrogenase [Tenericutes bacterium GWC2_34_14]OHE34987.1 MAG: 2-oxoisovalerate dehydrogenase [Tenericutes bacterium GWE2_34_108]OHE37153.1 MAG: 2-oxoisovalerate dehydrogenase [Tenericutes bacterium GWF1_35_14]OHE39715.1 MAG: 2-oxoisovalerate dehydrogenase [Tenericutes bacterium GWF2_35_184]OHE44097.1 MAG: 2-oxoisovalerate dehydrogenase [Tenericutes bacterium RIFOXYA2_FULL_36_32]OHE44653.